MKIFFVIAALALVEGRLNVPAFGPSIPMRRSGYNHVGNADNQNLSPVTYSDPLQTGLQYAQEHSPAQGGLSFVLQSHSRAKSTGITHLYLRQTFNGVEILNGNMNINVDKSGRVISSGSSFFDGDLASENNQKSFVASSFVTPIEAVRKFGQFLKLEDSELPSHSTSDENSFFTSGAEFVVKNVPFAAGLKVPVSLKYLIVPDENGQMTLKSVWDIVAEMKSGDNHFHAQVDIENGSVVQLNDWVREASYRVFPIATNDPSDGERKLVVNPENKLASPLGWNDMGNGRKFNYTKGNNVEAFHTEGFLWWRKTIHGEPSTLGKDLIFDHEIDFTKDARQNIKAALDNLFYMNNIMHDVFYQYGFDEESGNFQENNFNRGGREGDSVVASCQDGSGTNNANFGTPPDGQKPRMNMFVWTITNPTRDGDFDDGIIAHEYGHGITNRLTGGPMNVDCLADGESGGMGEGWGDFFALCLRMRPEYTNKTDFGMGEYVAKRGIRPYPYSTNMKTNPFTYGIIKKMGEVHAYGAVWATVLYDLYWLFVDQDGFSPDWYGVTPKRASGEEFSGNQKILSLVMDGLKLQPCSPSFVDARDAIIQADKHLFNGANYCLLWKGFARRGLGVDAQAGGNESFQVPVKCH